ncbi:hypothetical protein N185_17485 [Sinorhizobium sp. GW3]|nr:hypothetical protein N185_17485 [Sinorhizobium sp. GW3]
MPKGLLVLALAIPVTAGTGGLLGYRVNLTPSEPLGIWRIRALDRPIALGDLVFICPPQTKAMGQARARGYLRAGLCPGGWAPLIKTIVALPGQRVDVDGVVRIDGVSLARSKLSRKDGKGREMTPFGGGQVPFGHVFLHSGFSGSFDSRYFGPVPMSGILGTAEEVLTYVP